MISNINDYDVCPQRKKKDIILVLSLDKNFKSKVCEKYSDRAIIIGFAENHWKEVKSFTNYVKFFFSVFQEVNILIIDLDLYSEAIKFFYSAALNCKNIKEIFLYGDENNNEDHEFIRFNMGFSSAKEKTRSRQQFLNS